MAIETEFQKNQDLAVDLKLQATASAPKSGRIPALDFTKGALVLIMVFYHWINYFIGFQWKYYPYLRFLTPSFIFISGFMISHVYLSKYVVSDPRLWKRLFTRGLKLTVIFLALNLARNLVVPILGTGVAAQNMLSPDNLFTVFVSGNLPVFGSKLVSFPILVPISYLLMFSGILMFPLRRYRYTFHFTCLLLLLSVAMLSVFGYWSYNLEFVTIGMMGVLSGFIPVRMLNGIVRHSYLLALAYPCYVITITIWNTTFLLLIIGVVLSVMILYAVGAAGGEAGVVKDEVILLGKYSLLGYISQVAILQILSAIFSRMNFGYAALPIFFCAAFVLTIACVEAVHRIRSKNRSVDRLYKAVFA